MYDINLHNCTSQERHASSARRSCANFRFSSLSDIKLAIVKSKYSNVSLCSKRVFARWKLEKIDSKIKEVLGKICYERDDVWKALCYTACMTGTATQEFHSVPISSLCSSTLQSFANLDFPEFFNVFVVSVETPGTWKRPGIVKKGNREKTCGGQLWDSAGMPRSQNTIGVWWEKDLEIEKCFLKSRRLNTRANRDIKIWGRRRQRKRRWKSEFAFFQSSSRLL